MKFALLAIIGYVSAGHQLPNVEIDLNQSAIEQTVGDIA